MRCVCFMPSPPVMPWTRILLFSLRKIAMSVSSSLLRRGELSGAASRTVHGVDALDERVVRLGEDATTLVRVVAVEADDERLVDRVTVLGDELERLDDAVGDLVAGGDPTEDVDEDALDGRVAEDDLEAVGHDLRRGAATDVEEVRGLHATELLTGVGDDVEGAHDQTRAVADDADLAVELDVVEALLLRGGLEGVRVRLVLERGVVLVTELGVLVEGDLAVEGEHLAARVLHERVDLDQRRVLFDEHGPELLEDRDDLLVDRLVETAGGRDLARLRLVDPGDRVDSDAGESLGALDGELLDLHAALLRRHREVGAVRAVEDVGDVVLLGDVARLGDQHVVNGVALDVHAEDRLGLLSGLVGVGRELHATRLATTTGLDLGLDHDVAANALGCGTRFGDGVGD